MTIWTHENTAKMNSLHVNCKGTNILIESILFYFNKFCSTLLVSKVSENSLKNYSVWNDFWTKQH